MGSADDYEPKLDSPVKRMNPEDAGRPHHRENRRQDSRDDEVRDGERRDRLSRREDRDERNDRRGDERHSRGRSDRGDGRRDGDGYGARDAGDPRDRNRRDRDWPERSGWREPDDHRGSVVRERSPRGRDDREQRGSYRRGYDGEERPREGERGRDERDEPRSRRWSPTREDRGSRDDGAYQGTRNDETRNFRNDGGNERQGSPGLDRFRFILGEDGDEEGGAFNGGGGRGFGRGGGGGRGGGRGGRGGGRREEGTDALPELYSIHKSTVRSVRPFGIFVAMDGYRKHGLIHLSHVSEYEVTSRDDNDEAKVAALSSVAGEGESIWVKVVSIKEEDTDRPRIGVSMKLVNQRDGSDKDPNNLKLEEHQSRPQGGERAKFEIGAVLNVTCTRCGGHGHLKTECFASGEKHYELLGEEEEAQDGGGSNILQGRTLPPPPPLGDTRGLGRAGVGGAVGDGGGERFVLPEKVTSKEEALAVIAGLKLEKKKKKEEKEERRRKRREKKEKKKLEKKEKEKKREEKKEKKEKKDKKEKKEKKRKKEDRSDSESESESESDGSGEEEDGTKVREKRNRAKGDERHEEREKRKEQHKSGRRD